MTKVLECVDLVKGCDFKAEGATEAEVPEKAAEHARDVHGLEPNAELVEQVKAVIKDK